MRTFLKVFVSLFIVIVITAIFPKQASAQQSNVSFQVFYDQLSPYGQWVNYPNYGYVWIPDAGSDFEPYSTQGHWLLTDYGWTWVSDYSWGWAPFHYGRWDYDQNFGWFWVPGNEWGPAWVSWRMAEGYYGWAPMEPGISLSVSFGRAYDSQHDHWIFVRDRDIDRSDINHYYLSRTDKDRIVIHSSVVNNTYNDSRRNTTYITGPARTDFQKATGRQVNPIAIQEYNKPGQNYSNGRLQMYRPEVIKNSNSGRTSVPSRVTNISEVRKPSERKTTNQVGNSNPSNNIKKEGPPDKPNSVQPQNTNPSKNIRKAVQPQNIKTQNTNPPDNVKKDVRQVNVKSQNTNPPQNIRKVVQPQNIKQQNTNPPNNVKKDVRQVNVKSQNTNPPQNIKKVAPPVDIKQQKTGQPQNIKKDNQQNNTKVLKTNPSDNSRRVNSNSAKSSSKDNNDQQKKSEEVKKDK
jgi:hypothetical protein